MKFTYTHTRGYKLRNISKQKKVKISQASSDARPLSKCSKSILNEIFKFFNINELQNSLEIGDRIHACEHTHTHSVKYIL